MAVYLIAMRRLLIICLGLFCAFYANSQTHEWAKKIRCFPTTGNSSVFPTALATDDSNHVYIGGVFKDSLFIENDTHFFQSNGTNRAIYIAKFREDGTLVWSKSITSALTASLKDIVINSSGSIILYGDYSTSSVNPSISFGTISLSRSRGVFVAFMNSRGTFTSARDLGYGSFVTATAIKLGPKDEIYSYFYLNGFGVGWTINSTSGAVTGSGFVHVFCKHDSLGRQLRWHQDYDINQHIELGNIGVEPNGNLIYSFRAGTNQTIHGISTRSATPLLLIRAASNNGNIQKIERIEVAGNASIQSIECPRANEIYVMGFAKGDSIEVGGIKAKSPNQLGAIRPFYFNASLYDLDSAKWVQASTASPFMFVGSSKMVYSGGFLYAGILVSADSFVMGGLRERRSSGSSSRIQSIVAKFDTLGNALWMLKTPSAATPFIRPIGRSDVVYYSVFKDTVSLPPFTLSKPGTTLWPFLAKTFDFTIERGAVFSGPYCAGDSIIVPYTKTGGYDTANFFVAEISDEDGNFTGRERELGRIKSTEDSVITGVLPLLQVASSDRYRIRIRSTAPAVQSFFREDTLNLLIYSRDKADPGPDTSICIGDTMQLRTFGGTTWSWSPFVNMDDSSSRTPLIWPDTNTVYQIIIGDSSGCGAPDTAQLLVKLLDPPRIDTVQVSDSFACIGQHIQLSALFSGGTGIYTAHWQDSFGMTLRTAQSSLGDTFSFVFRTDTSFLLILTDSCSEIIDSSRFIVRQVPDYLIAPDLIDSALCYGTELLLAVQPSFERMDSLKVKWFEQNTLVSDSLSWLKTWLDTDSVRYQLNNTCTNQEIDTTFEIKVFNRPEVSINQSGFPPFFCVGQEIPLVALPGGGNGNYFYQWTVNGQSVSSDSLFLLSVEDIPGINLAENDSVHVKLQLLDSCSSVGSRDSMLVFTRKSLQLNNWNITDSIFCQGDTLEFAATAEGGNGNYNFSWSVDGIVRSNDSIFTFVPSDIGAGIGTVRLVLSDNCSVPDTIEKQVTIPDSLQGEILSDEFILLCLNEDLLFNSLVNGGNSDDAQFSWQLNGLFISDSSKALYRAIKADPFQAITDLVTLEITDACSQYPVLDSVSIQINNRMVLSLIGDSSMNNQRLDSTLCYGQDMRLAPSFHNITSDDQHMEWQLDGVPVSDQPSFTFGPTYYRNNEFDYALLAVGYDSCSGLFDTLTININLLDSLSINPIADTVICLGSDLNLNGAGSGGKSANYQWQWRSVADNRVLSNSANLSLSDITQDIGLQLQLTDACSQENALESVFVSVLDSLSLNQLQDNWCFRDQQNIMVTPAGGIAADYRFEWFVNGQFIRSDDQDNYTISGDSMYRYQVVLKDACSYPSDTLSGLAAHIPEIAFVQPMDTSCEVYLHDLNPRDTSKTNSQFELFLNQERQSSNSQVELIAGTYSFMLLAQNQADCKDSVQFDLFVKPLPDASFGYSPQQPTEDEPLVRFQANAQDLDAYFWTINGEDLGSAAQLEYLFKDSGLYVVQLQGIKNGCESNTSTEIRFIRKFEFLGVNAFSPNNDGVNDRFIPNFTGVSHFSYSIYNRWGAKIFEGDQNTAWDGSYNSRPVMAGTYLVIIEAVDPDGRQYYLNQRLQVLR